MINQEKAHELEVELEEMQKMLEESVKRLEDFEKREELCPLTFTGITMNCWGAQCARFLVLTIRGERVSGCADKLAVGLLYEIACKGGSTQ